MVDLKAELDYLSHIIQPMVEYLNKINEINKKFNKSTLDVQIQPNSEEFQNLLSNVLDSKEMSLFVGNGNLIRHPENELSSGYRVDKTQDVIRNYENVRHLIKKLFES